MFRLKYSIAAILFICSLYSQEEYTLQPGTVVKFAGIERAKELMRTEDEYTAGLSRFDIQSKSQKTTESSLNDYLEYACEQNTEWTEDEKKNMGGVIESVGKKLSELGIKPNMPPVIEIIKSSNKNEGSAEGYTRGSYMVLKDSRISGNKTGLEQLFTHELFHILSRYDTDMRNRVYNTIGFRKCNEVIYPEEIRELKISNPDSPLNNYFITVKHEDKPVDVMLILFSGKQYSGGNFFSYLRIGLLAVEGDSDGKKPVYREGKPLILKAGEVELFYEQVGRNTGYIFHAEEISADHFEILLSRESGVPNPELIELMFDVLKQPKNLQQRQD